MADDGVAVHAGAAGLSALARPSGVDFATFAPGHLLVLAAVVAAAGFMHGAIGFGFPIMAMPVLNAEQTLVGVVHLHDLLRAGVV